jgi:hypothetical protein
MRNLCCYWAQLRASSPGEYAALGKLAEGRGFEPMIRKSGFRPFGRLFAQK